MKKIIKKLSILFASLAMVMGAGLFDGAKEVKAENTPVTETRTWDLTTSNNEWEGSGTVEYFSQPYGIKKAGPYIINSNISELSSVDFSSANVINPTLKLGVKSLCNGSAESKLTISMVDSSKNVLGDGVVIAPVNASNKDKTTWQYANLTPVSGVTGFKIECTTFKKNILINGASFELSYESQSAPVDASEIIDKINAIGTVEYTTECKEKIDAARNTYDAASQELKDLVTNYSVLTAAEAEYARLEADAKETADLEAATAFEAMVDALPEAETLTDYSKKSEIDAMVAAYNALTDDQKALVTADKVAKMNALVLKIEEFKPLEIKITKNSFGGVTGSYDWYDWTDGLVTGQAYIYATNKNQLQFNKNSTDNKGALFNKSEMPGNISSVSAKLTSEKTARDWNLYVSKTAFTTDCAVSDATLISKQKVGEAGATWNVTGEYKYFMLQEAQTGATYLDYVTVSYEKDDPNKEKVTLDQSNLKMRVGDVSSAITATVTPNAKEVTWKSSNENVATVANGVVTAVGVGTANITAVTSDTNVSSGNCVVTVKEALEHKGTENDPYTVADAIKVAEDAGNTPTENSYYVTGIVSNVNVKDRIYIADPTRAAGEFFLYSIKDASGNKVTATNYVVGDKITACGPLQLFNGAAEMNGGTLKDVEYVDVTNFINSWKSLRDESGSICGNLAADKRTILQALIDEYDSYATIEEKQTQIANTLEDDGVTTIGTTIEYLRAALKGEVKTNGDYGITPTESASNILTEVKDSSTIVILVAVLGVIAISAYYFVEKRKFAK